MFKQPTGPTSCAPQVHLAFCAPRTLAPSLKATSLVALKALAVESLTLQHCATQAMKLKPLFVDLARGSEAARHPRSARSSVDGTDGESSLRCPCSVMGRRFRKGGGFWGTHYTPTCYGIVPSSTHQLPSGSTKLFLRPRLHHLLIVDLPLAAGAEVPVRDHEVWTSHCCLSRLGPTGSHNLAMVGSRSQDRPYDFQTCAGKGSSKRFEDRHYVKTLERHPSYIYI